jgi:hypothetical protein
MDESTKFRRIVEILGPKKARWELGQHLKALINLNPWVLE